MDTFQITVLSIATIVLFGILIVVGMLMRKEGKSVPFPPVSTDCPDGWKQNGKMCIPNVLNKGIFKSTTDAVFITDLSNNSDNSNFRNYTPGLAFCGIDGSGSSWKFTDNYTDLSCNKFADKQKIQECKTCLSIPFSVRNKADASNGIVMTDELWSAGGKSARCAKKAWANRFGFNWDGVSNYNSCN